MSLSETVRRVVRAVGWGSKVAWEMGETAPRGRLYVPEAMYDSLRTHFADALTFSSLRAKLRAGESGDLATTLQLFEDIETKDIRLASVADTRRDTLTGLDWEITSAADIQRELVDRALADEAAAYVRETLGELSSFEDAMEHLGTAIGTNLAVAELVWERGKLAELVPIPSWRLTAEVNTPGEVRVITKEQPRGVVAGLPKFVVHIPRNRAGCPLTNSLCYRGAPIYLIKLLAIADWAKFCEVYGMPIRWGQYRTGSTTEEREEALDMLEAMGSAAYGLFSEGIQFDLKESSQRGTAPYKDLVEWCDRTQAINWLGEHMTTDTTGATGTYAAAEVQDDTRQARQEDDIRRERRMVREQIIAPMVAFGFPRYDVPVPVFERVKPEPVDEMKEADKFIKAQQMGVRIPERHARERLGIPEPEREEEILTPAAEFFEQGLNEGM